MEFPEPAAVRLSELKPDPRNARKHSGRNVEEIARSLEEFGQHRPFVVQKSTGRILVGNGMYEAMKQLGWTEGLALYVGDDDETAVRRALADNRTGELAEWDWPVLKDILQDLGPEPDVPGWTDKELEDLFDLSDFSPGGAGAEDECPEAPEEPATKPGDIYSLGNHRLICGDSTKEDEILRLLDGELCDLVFTDPPYGVNYSGKRSGNIQGDLTQVAIPFSFDIAVNIATKPNAAFYFCGGELNLSLYYKLFEKHLRQIPKLIIWEKENFVLSHSGYHRQYELIYHGWKGSVGWLSDRKGENASDIWKEKKGSAQKYLHPTQKPVGLPMRAIRNHCPEGGLALDPFGGSGTTLIACEQTGRVCRMAELDPGYCDVIVRRWEGFTGRKAELLQAGA